jgi:hypothetical protein
MLGKFMKQVDLCQNDEVAHVNILQQCCQLSAGKNNISKIELEKLQCAVAAKIPTSWGWKWNFGKRCGQGSSNPTTFEE